MQTVIALHNENHQFFECYRTYSFKLYYDVRIHETTCLYFKSMRNMRKREKFVVWGDKVLPDEASSKILEVG